MVHLTDNAVKQLKALAAEHNLQANVGLRLSVEKGGCAGLQYAMSITECQSEDIVVEKEGARVFIDPASMNYLEDSIIDYEDSLSGAGFRIRNPHASRSCGCGTSFDD